MERLSGEELQVEGQMTQLALVVQPGGASCPPSPTAEPKALGSITVERCIVCDEVRIKSGSNGRFSSSSLRLLAPSLPLPLDLCSPSPWTPLPYPAALLGELLTVYV